MHQLPNRKRFGYMSISHMPIRPRCLQTGDRFSFCTLVSGAVQMRCEDTVDASDSKPNAPLGNAPPVSKPTHKAGQARVT